MANGRGSGSGTVVAPEESVPHATTAPPEVSARPWFWEAAMAAMLLRPAGRVGGCPQATTVLLVRRAMHHVVLPATAFTRSPEGRFVCPLSFAPQATTVPLVLMAML